MPKFSIANDKTQSFVLKYQSLVTQSLLLLSIFLSILEPVSRFLSKDEPIKSCVLNLIRHVDMRIKVKRYRHRHSMYGEPFVGISFLLSLRALEMSKHCLQRSL